MKTLYQGAWIVWLYLATLAPAQGQKGVFTDPKEAGPDFKIQGEYVGAAPNQGKLGAQVVALGNGQFDAYFHQGGLPGAGWDGQPRTKARATTQDGKTTFLGGGWSGSIADGKLTGKTADGDEFTLSYLVRQSSTLGAKAPRGALVLFDGSNVAQWEEGRLVEGNLLDCGTKSQKGFGVGKLHLEFRTPFQPTARGQGRGNSGVFIHDREIQVLDSFGLTGEKHDCGAFFNSARPTVNMCLPPLSWQTYDVEVRTGPDRTLLATVWHNGVKIHEEYAIKGTANRAVPIALREQGHPVVYRNIWIAPFVEEKNKNLPHQ